MNKTTRNIAILLLGACCLLLSGCNANVGVGMSVGVPVGSHGHMRIGGSSWL